MLLTPDYAAKLLRDSSQEGVRHERLLWIAENFESMQGSSMSLGDDGNLIDGHHRCVVVILTGKCLEIVLQTEPYHYHFDFDESLLAHRPLAS